MLSGIIKTGSKILPVLLLLILLNCATEKNYKVLSFFFDGVPKPGEKAEVQTDPNALAGQQQKNDTGEIRLPIISRHPDYANGNCDKCHDRSARNFLKTQRDSVCFTCHDPNEFQGKFVHGPVAVTDCMFCHLPHESQYSSLLTKNGTDVCLDCHLKPDILANPAHDGKGYEVSDSSQQAVLCTDCHYAHSAGNGYFLKNVNWSPQKKE